MEIISKPVSDHFFTDSLIDSSRLSGSISDDMRSFMTQMVEFEDHPTSAPPVTPVPGGTGPASAREKPAPQILSPAIPQPHASAPNAPASDIPAMVSITASILHDLEMNLPKLLGLNPSRRQAIAQHLDHLAGINAPASSPPDEAMGRLRRWIEGSRTPAQNNALKTYFEEVAVICLGQALLLKNWSDRGMRKWNESDLGRLNWALSTALKSHVPLDREGWHITRPNFYSWYNPGTPIQKEIWKALESWKISDEGPTLLYHLLNPARRARPEFPEPAGYDSRFYKELWKCVEDYGFNPNPDTGFLKRQKIVFSPTLRDGSLVRTGPPTLTWVGLEPSAFQLMLAELMQIWWGPAAPPLWSAGTGLEVHAKDQLAFALSSPKPSLICRIAEMEACEAAFVLEEQIVRAQGRQVTAIRFKEQLDHLPYFKKIRSSGTSLGDLQACVALSKLRPGGLLWWAREEVLSVKDGTEVLNFLLERAKLLCEWDFSELEHTLPSALPLFPKHLYLFQKETNIEARLSHRPMRRSIQGQLRSHVELPLLLTDALKSPVNSAPHSASSNGNSHQLSVPAKAHWKMISHLSPTPQKDWLEKWPNPASQSLIRKLDQLRSASLPLANFTTIRPTPDGDSERSGAWSVHFSMKGFWISAEWDPNEGRKLVAQPLPTPDREARGSGFLVLLPDETWVAPLSIYLMSSSVNHWLEQNAERRGERWVLKEQVVKWIPVPRNLLKVLRAPSALEEDDNPSFVLPLPGQWERLAAEAGERPQMVRQALAELPQDESHRHIHATLFVRAALALDHIRAGQSRLLSLVNGEGRIRWRELIEVLPKAECVPLTIHSRIRMSGSMPPHIPIHRMERVKSPAPGILLATETGFNLTITIDAPLLLTILWEMLEGLSHPTWNEILQYVRIPKKVELAESTAFEVLRCHAEQTTQMKELQALLDTCQLF